MRHLDQGSLRPHPRIDCMEREPLRYCKYLTKKHLRTRYASRLPNNHGAASSDYSSPDRHRLASNLPTSESNPKQHGSSEPLKVAIEHETWSFASESYRRGQALPSNIPRATDAHRYSTLSVMGILRLLAILSSKAPK